IDARAKTLTYLGAGEQAYLLDGAGQIKQVLRATCMPLGIDLDSKEAAPKVSLADGDILVLVTDGVVEARSPGAELFGWRRIVEVVRDARRDSAQEIVQKLCAAAQQFGKPNPQADDMTAAIIKVGEAWR